MKKSINQQTISFIGIDGFDDILPVIAEYCEDRIDFQIALNEAINNAMRYAKAGIDQAPVTITLRKNGQRVMAKVVGDTTGFDVRTKLAQAKQNMSDWVSKVSNQGRGRGIYMMLQATKKLVYNQQGTEVILAA